MQLRIVETLHNIETRAQGHGRDSSQTTSAPVFGRQTVSKHTNQCHVRPNIWNYGFFETEKRYWLELTTSQVSLPSKCCLGSYLNSALFCEGGKQLPLEVKLTKLPGFSTFAPPLTLVERFFDRFLGERLLGRAPKALGGGE